ncbi:MAG: hypothetical protein ABI618_11580 [Nitrospirota bacterium]
MEFYHGLNLCDHLARDAMALDLKKSQEQRQGSATISVMNATQTMGDPNCPRFRGLMLREQYVDWESNGDFEGWRCFSCGNIWDGVIADNRLSVDGRIKPQAPIRLPRHMVQPMSIRPMSGSQDVSVRK